MIIIRPLDIEKEYADYASLDMDVHGTTLLDVYPIRGLIKATHYGALLVGAFLETGELVGVDLCIPALRDGKVVLSSQTLAVKEGYRNLRIGERLRLAQRDHAIQSGINTIVFPFDPLNSHNASLYCRKLGGRGISYVPNYFGETTFLFQAGIPTDRLLVDWVVQSERVIQRLASTPQNTVLDPSLPIVLRNHVHSDQRQIPVDAVQDASYHRFYLEIPHQFRLMITADPESAHRWRRVSRDLFLFYLQHGFQVTDLYAVSEENRTRYYYVLDKGVS
jgi:predicted GNAT superfamily acetyltransferase